MPGVGPPGAGLLAFGAGLGAAPGAPGTPHTAAAAAAAVAAAQAHPLLKPDLHREEIKSGSGSIVNEERLQNSVSPGERDKYASRSPPEIQEQEAKRRKEDKLGHVS